MQKTRTSVSISEKQSTRLAVLIDADNASPKTIKHILDEIAKFGESAVKRIYGNFVGGGGEWKRVINAHAIKPMQQFVYTTGKNATDGFMIIDAMDLLYTERFDGFCLVSSDSDFTALAIRLKEQGLSVYGFGKKTTPEAFRNACSRFIYVENICADASDSIPTDVKNSQVDSLAASPAPPTAVTIQPLPMQTIQKIFEQSDTEWMAASVFGSFWKRLQIDFDPRNYGAKKLTDLIRNHPAVFIFENRKNTDGTHEHLYLKLREWDCTDRT